MKFIVGLGNIGEKYANTRHNIGFMTVDLLAAQLGVSFAPTKFFALTAKATLAGEVIYLVKPTTYMNDSGKAVRALLNFYGGDVADVLILVDDMDMDLGKLRFRAQGSAGGHNGLKSLFAHLGTQQLWRLKMGIGHAEYEHGAVIDYVLGKFTKSEMALVEPQMDRATRAVEAWIQEPDVGKLGNTFNG
ncbi:MAG TPA: aminoacyl-tRNA hydrolase [Lactobacillaceae bacterium]|jgi:PTH1 family peptidyl-tRNA hydrolase